MVIGDPSTFAIESGITQAYKRLSLRALGFFTLLIDGRRYGVLKPDATMLACSFDEVGRRNARRGSHIAPTPLAEAKADEIANAVYRAMYVETPSTELFLGMSLIDFNRLIYSNQLMWIPDGDQAFDDGSYVLQLDIENHVRLVAFQSAETYQVDLKTIRETRVLAGTFYNTLQAWQDAFELEWQQAPKE